MMPWADTHAMGLHLAEISEAVDLGAHAVVILDQAGWHTSRHLVVPNNITLVSLPPRSPELNPVENDWQFIRPYRRCASQTPAGHGELALEPDLCALRRHRHYVLRSMEQAHRTTLTHHDVWHARLREWLLIKALWYNRS